jgi:hypothetical protein
MDEDEATRRLGPPEHVNRKDRMRSQARRMVDMRRAGEEDTSAGTVSTDAADRLRDGQAGAAVMVTFDGTSSSDRPVPKAASRRRR